MTVTTDKLWTYFWLDIAKKTPVLSNSAKPYREYHYSLSFESLLPGKVPLFSSHHPQQNLHQTSCNPYTLLTVVAHTGKFIQLEMRLMLGHSTVTPLSKFLCVPVRRHLVQAVRSQHSMGDRDLCRGHLHQRQRHRCHRRGHQDQDHVSVTTKPTTLTYHILSELIYLN